MCFEFQPDLINLVILSNDILIHVCLDHFVRKSDKMYQSVHKKAENIDDKH